MKHTIEFNYDGCDQWAYNGGYIMTAREVQMYIGREAFFEGLKHGNSFKAVMTVTIEPIGKTDET